MARYFKTAEGWMDSEDPGYVNPGPFRATIRILLNSDFELFTVEEVAEALRLSDVTVRRLCQTGDLQAVKLGTTYRITRDGLAAIKPLEPSATTVPDADPE